MIFMRTRNLLRRILPAALFVFIMVIAPQTSSGIVDYMLGVASWYSEFSPGIRETTANMEKFDHNKLTCASWDYPFDTVLEVINIDNGKKVLVRVNDRGPAKRLYRKGRIIDLTKKAFQNIADLDKGLIKVKVRAIRS